MTRRDKGLVGALGALFITLAIVITLPGMNRPIAPGRGATPSASDGTGQSPPGGGSSDGTAGPSATPGGTGQPGRNVIRHGVVGIPTSINPLTARTQPDRDLVALVFSGLVKLGPKETLLPDLADRWTVDATGTHWTFHIRTTATWHDGEPVTADDVVFTVKLLRDPGYTGPYRGSWSEITALRVDAQTVRFDLLSPLGDFLQLARQPLLPAHLLRSLPVQALVDSAFSAAPVGSGPYRLVQWDETSATLERTSDFFVPVGGEPAPAATAAPGDALGLELLFYPTAQALADAVRAGDVDMADGLPADLAKALLAVPGTRLIRYPRATLTAVLLNVRTNFPMLREQAVRQALLKAIDRVKLVEEVMGGFGNRADSMVPPTSWAYVKKAAAPVEYSTTHAAQQLKAAGWRKVNGKWHQPGSKSIFTIEIVTTSRTSNPVVWEAAQYVARAWRSFGFTVKVTALAPSVLVGERLSQANFMAAVVDMNIGLDPDLYPLLASRQAGIAGSNLSGVQSLVLDDLLLAARKPGTLAQRRSAWAKLESFLAEAQVTLPLAFRDDPLVVSSRVTGPRPRLEGDRSDRFWDVLTWRLVSGA